MRRAAPLGRRRYHTDAMSLTDLHHYIRVYDDDLEGPLCRQMIESFAGLKRFQTRNGRGVRAGLEESAWTELNVTRVSDPGFAQMFRLRIDAALERYNRDIGLGISLPNSGTIDKLVMKRYRPGTEERFQVHFDAIHHVANRYLVLLWYLNDVREGGETRFPQLDFAVAPRGGRLLMFPPYWMYQHEGTPPVSEDKYILSTYLLFTSAPSNPQAS
jgi:2OG-Fe(II) oxygenase superfamily